MHLLIHFTPRLPNVMYDILSSIPTLLIQFFFRLNLLALPGGLRDSSLS